MSLHKGLIGKSEGGGSVNDKTLGDYITRKTRYDAFTQVAAEQTSKNLDWVEEAINDCYNQPFKCVPTTWKSTTDALHIQLFGAELVLLKTGEWFISDTSGG